MPWRRVSEQRRRWRPGLVALGLVIGVAVLLAATAVPLLAARTDLEAGRAAADRGVQAVRDTDVDAAADAFLEAEYRFSRAGRWLRNPLVGLAGLLPVARPNLAAARGLADAGALVAEAGRTATGAVADLPGGVAALAPSGGALPIAALEAIGPPLTDARVLLERATARAEATPRSGLVPQVAEARATLLDQLGEAGAAVSAAEPLVRALPAFLGEDRPRRYFFGAAQPSELRGVTGFIGAYAVLTLDRGRFSFSDFRPIQELPVAPPGTVPPPNPDFLTRYGDFGGTGFWQNLNVSPDFPSTGVAVERLWEATFGERLDGTITADPFALAALLELAGPTEVPGVGTVDAETVVPFVSNEAYSVLTDPEERKRLLGDVAAAALRSYLNAGLGAGDTAEPAAAGEPAAGEPAAGGASALAALRALGSAAGEGHVIVHAADPEVQEAFAGARLAGELQDPPGDFFSVFLNGASGSKIDYYLGRELDYEVTLRPDGSAGAVAALRLLNDAPSSGQPNYVIGPNVDRVVAGENELYVGAYLDTGAELAGFTADGEEGLGELQSELGHPVVETFEELPSGTDRTLVYDIDNPRGWTVTPEGGRYELTIQGQSAIRATRLRLEVRLPEGATVLSASDGLEVAGDVVRFAGEVRGDLSVAVTFASGG